eukprot:4568737-Karenia_brevis.AAC.1
MVSRAIITFASSPSTDTGLRQSSISFINACAQTSVFVEAVAGVDRAKEGSAENAPLDGALFALGWSTLLFQRLETQILALQVLFCAWFPCQSALHRQILGLSIHPICWQAGEVLDANGKVCLDGGQVPAHQRCFEQLRPFN